MSKQTKIAWCDSTINFWEGCTKVSAGCQNCYAETHSKRFYSYQAENGEIKPLLWGAGTHRRKVKNAVENALKYNRKPWICPDCGHAHESNEGVQVLCCPDNNRNKYRRRRIFSLSLGDCLDDEAPIEWLAEMLNTIRQCDQVTWILCTKRPENWYNQICSAGNLLRDSGNIKTAAMLASWVRGNPPSNIILLTSVECQEQADKRIPELLRIPAACRGLSMEPLLGAVDLSKWILKDACGCDENEPESGDGFKCKHCKDTHAITELDLIIIGGESGNNARPCNVDWIRNLLIQGQAAKIPVFVKQIHDDNGKLLKDINDFPQDLQIQQWPKGF